ncbi:uncharacterized protein LOC123905016 [Trifolium pratense]|uniref:uncharacterized protein LOC123905014 n=1 Tax=Trifolium pratense TaxID=57577 RepID=UPI001E696C40|nr:uncharacterized protein LOC123905014 [Trifolium pratense]XP_045810579.1 uncharacterized protein LOC123905015 [Trifolium pratense]XP_045810580.1 uncharacterized protein LOC123905016 [Trifolium pratense]
MEVAWKRSIDEEPHAEKQVERVVKKQKVETIEGKPHVTTYPILAEKQEVENAKKPHSKNKNEEVVKPEVEVAKVESSEGSNESFDLDKVESSECSDEDFDLDRATYGQWVEWSPCNDFDEDEYYARWAQMKTTISADSNIDDDMSSEDE